MATEFWADAQSRVEVLPYVVNFDSEIPQGTSINEALVVHILPSGIAASEAITAQIDGERVKFDLGPVALLGPHEIFVQALLSTGYRLEAKINVPVYW